MAQAPVYRPSGFITRISAWPKLRPSRTVALPLVGAAIGLGLALAATLHPTARPVAAVPAGYVALVNQRPILMNDFISETEMTTNMPFAQTTPEQRRQVLRVMIDEELMVQRALVLDLPEQSTEVRKELVDSLTSVVLSERPPSEKDLIAYFNANRAHYLGDGTMRFHDIVLHVGGYENVDQTVEQANADASEAVYQLRAGTPLDAVMQHFGFVNSGHASGDDDFDFAVKLHIGQALFDVASKLTDGEISDPVRQPDGIHVLVMEQRIPPQPATFAAKRDAVYSDYRLAAQHGAEENNLKFLRANAQILLAPGQSE
jgi:hypothetical protein